MDDAAPKLSWSERLRAWARENAHGPYAVPALVVLSFAESVFFSVPVDTFLIPLVIIRARSWLYYVLVSSVASVLGGIAGYAIGYFFFDAVGHYIVALYHIESTVQVVASWLSAHAFITTFASAFTPIPYKVFTLSAGLFHVPFLMFFIVSVVGRTLRYLLVGYVAHRFGARLAGVFMERFATITLIALVALVALYVLIQFL